MRRPFLSFILLVVLAAPLRAQTVDSTREQPLMEVPGGVAELAQRLGIGGNVLRAQIPLTAIRLFWEVPEGADPASDERRVETLAYLRGAAAGSRPGGQAADLVPAVLPPQAWSVLLGEAGVGKALFVSILADRQAALLYYGLASLDPPTRQYLLENPGLLGHLRERGLAGVFATFARSLRIRADEIGNPVSERGQDSRSRWRIEVPGGAEAEPLWETVTSARPSDPVPFMLAVLQKGTGRLALLYDGIAHMDEGARRFAFGLHLPAEERLERFEELYEASGAALRTWDPAKRPFERMPFDAVHLLLSAPIHAGGTLPGPAWPAFWESVFRPTVTDVAAAVDRDELEEDPPLDAAGLIRSISVRDPVERRTRSETWLFAARAFPQVSLADAADVLVALRGFWRYPSLLLALERLGISSPATCAAAARAAERMTDADHRLVQFQAALALIERARAARAIDTAAAETVVRALCHATPVDGGEYDGAVARWLERDFLAIVPETVVPAGLDAAARPLEFRVLAAMAGSVASSPNTALLALPPVAWEGLTYRLDPAGSTLRRLVLVRARQGGCALDRVLSLGRLGDAIETAKSADEAHAAARQLPDAVAALQACGDPASSPAPVDPGRLEGLVTRTLRDVKKLKPVPDAKRLARIARPLHQAADRYLADVLRSLVYAPILGEPDGPALLSGDPSRAHDLRFFKARSELGRRTAWEPAVEARDARLGWHLSGSLLNLDLAAGRLALRRLFRETIPETPRLADAVRQVFTETALLITPFDLGEASRSALLAAVEGGRSRVRQLGPSSAAIERLAAEMGLDEWRTEVLRWSLDHEPNGTLGLFSLAELARAGGLDEASVPGTDAWGTTGLARDRGLTLSFPPHRFWTTISGRRGVAAAAALVPDLTIGLAESSARLGLPAAVTPGLLLVATQEFIDTLRTTHADDWPAIVAHAQAVARDGIEDYVAGLTITGPLVPLEK